jgi:hypothetical protein
MVRSFCIDGQSNATSRSRLYVLPLFGLNVAYSVRPSGLNEALPYEPFWPVIFSGSPPFTLTRYRSNPYSANADVFCPIVAGKTIH